MKKSLFVLGSLAIAMTLTVSCGKKKVETPPPPPAPSEVAATKVINVDSKSFAGANAELLITEGVAKVTETSGGITFVGNAVPNTSENTIVTTSYLIKKEVIKDKKGKDVKKQIALDGFSKEGIQYLYNGKKHSVLVAKVVGETKGWTTITATDKKTKVKTLIVKKPVHPKEKPAPPKAPAKKK